jgi:hypothetical protein
MEQHPQFDLTRPTEATRRIVYDRVAELVWTPDPEDEHRRTDTPDEAGLFVFHVYGRWFAVWTNHDEPNLPEEQRTEIVRVQADPDSGFGITLSEV